MKRFSQSLQILTAALGVISLSGRGPSLAATIQWVNPAPVTPGASAPLPPQTSPPHKTGPAASVAAPAMPRPVHSPLAAQANSFINTYWQNVSGSADHVLPYLRSIYAPLVHYYGTAEPRGSVLRDKSNFIRRWPIRETGPVPGAENPTISCNDAASECEITGLRTFDAVSPDRRAHSVGVVRYSYTVRFLDGRPEIVAEASQIAKRTGVTMGSTAPAADQAAAESSRQ